MTASRIVITAFVGLWSISAFAQDTPPGNQAGQQGQTAPDTNNNGPAAADQNNGKTNNPNTDPNAVTSIQPPTGPEIVDDPNATPEQKASAEYSGPAVLSRGISASEPMNPQNVKFTPSAGVDYVYNSGLSGATLGPNGTLSNASASGVSLNYSLIGTKVFKKDIFSLTFTGNLNHYFNQTQFDGSSDALAMTWRHSVTRHLSFGIQLSADQFNQNNLLLSGAQYINTGAGTTLLTSTPATEAFYGRVFSFYTQGSLTYQVNARLSINLSGSGFLTRREDTSLYGDTGYQAGADVAYRVTRQTTIGTYFSYTHFDFLGLYGSTNTETAGLTYSVAFTPRTELVTRVGGSRVITDGLSNVNLNPLLTLLFGTGSVEEALHQVNYTPDLNLQLRHKARNLNLSLAYARGITPGNGVILTSTRQTASAGADFKIGREWSFNTTVGYDTLAGIGPTANESYTSVFAAASVIRQIHRSLGWHARFDYHHYLFDNTGYLRSTSIFATGLVWNPGNLLERVW